MASSGPDFYAISKMVHYISVLQIWIMRHLNFLTIPAKPPSDSDGEYNQYIMNFRRFSAKVRRPGIELGLPRMTDGRSTTALSSQVVK